jgi:hypothetical protein
LQKKTPCAAHTNGTSWRPVPLPVRGSCIAERLGQRALANWGGVGALFLCVWGCS